MRARSLDIVVILVRDGGVSTKEHGVVVGHIGDEKMRAFDLCPNNPDNPLNHA